MCWYLGGNLFRKTIVLLLVMFIMAGCTGQDNAEIKTALQAVQSDLAAMQNNLVAVQSELTAVQTKVQEMENPTPTEGDYGFVLSSGIIINRAGNGQSITFPVHGISTYGDFDSFRSDWDNAGEPISTKLAWTRPDQNSDWNFYYKDKMLTTDVYMSWAPYNIVSPINSAEPNTAVQIEYGPTEAIASSQTFADESVMEASLMALDAASTFSTLLNDDYQFIFLVSNRTRGQDSYQLVVIDSLIQGPDISDDPPTAEYCQRCSGWYCKWRCWRAGHPTQ